MLDVQIYNFIGNILYVAFIHISMYKQENHVYSNAISRSLLSDYTFLYFSSLNQILMNSYPVLLIHITQNGLQTAIHIGFNKKERAVFQRYL